ncbi:MAG: PP2C family protein-serine/threonine phosphatase, partial [Candidatus Promineifilaceae bacterium]|nr:PP2C family protein-serine/threonine phosphatase [Candidatus Promineifilaceae bacterium]
SWAGALVLGPASLWMVVLYRSASRLRQLRRESSIDRRWGIARGYFQELAFALIGSLAGLSVYQALGGGYPLPALEWSAIRMALAASVAHVLVALVLIIPFARRLLEIMTMSTMDFVATPRTVLGFLLLGINMSYVVLPFSILAAGLYRLFGLGIFLFFVAGAFMASLLAHRLSLAVQRSGQRTQELAALESLGRAIIDAPPDDETALPRLLEEHLTGLFPRAILHVWLKPDIVLYQSSHTTEVPRLAEARELVESEEADSYQLQGVRLAEETFGQITRQGLIVPIISEEDRLRGGIYVLLREDYGDVVDFLPALQSVAAQIAAALRRTDVHRRTIESERMTRELEVAGQIQASFLPRAVPALTGWHIAALLEPARQTSGDFYDFVDLDDGRLGLLVADVADKGTGAALYMALSRTLIRTYAKQFPADPELALRTANERILEDTGSAQFVTVFFGILDAASGERCYANAGHNPAFLLNANGTVAPQALSNTGIPLGMFPEMSWRQNRVILDPGDLLVMYTDGITEAQDSHGQEFGESRLLAAVTEGLKRDQQAGSIAERLLSEVRAFVGQAPQFDDITLLVLRRQIVSAQT